MASTTASQIGAALRAARERSELSQADLAEAAGVARATISRIEMGQRTGRIEQLANIARVLEISVHELVPAEEVAS